MMINEFIFLEDDINELLDNCVNGNIIILGDVSLTKPLFHNYSINQLTFLEALPKESNLLLSFDMVIVDDTNLTSYQSLENAISSLLQQGIAEKKGKKIVVPQLHHKILVNSLAFVMDNFPVLSLYLLFDTLKQKGITSFYFQEPNVFQVRNRTRHEEELNQLKFSFRDVLSDSTEYCNSCSELQDWERLLIDLSGKENAIRYYEDIKKGNRAKNISIKNKLPFYEGRSKYINFLNGLRFTTDNPSHYRNSIYIIGRSTIQGMRLEDSDTMPSHLQRAINEQYPNQYRVVNYSFPSIKPKDMQLILERITFTPGDIVLIFWMKNENMKNYFLHQNTTYNFDLQFLFQRPHALGEVFFDVLHYNAAACNAIAQHVTQELRKKGAFQFSNNSSATFTIKSEDEKLYIDEIRNRPEFQNYLKSVIKHTENQWDINNNSIIGSIVMNCNPFTLGHKYLIESALAACDYLYIFIVEEDRSEYTFTERIQLVQEEFKINRRICIVGSGNYIISRNTFPEYFEKKNLQNLPVNPAADILIFSECIAPILQISKRFVGEEPFDTVTKQYNEQMSSLLPKNKIEFVEIPRKEHNATAISASYVRKLIQCWNPQNKQILKSIVSPHVYNFLVKKHFQEEQ